MAARCSALIASPALLPCSAGTICWREDDRRHAHQPRPNKVCGGWGRPYGCTPHWPRTTLALQRPSTLQPPLASLLHQRHAHTRACTHTHAHNALLHAQIRTQNLRTAGGRWRTPLCSRWQTASGWRRRPSRTRPRHGRRLASTASARRPPRRRSSPATGACLCVRLRACARLCVGRRQACICVVD